MGDLNKFITSGLIVGVIIICFSIFSGGIHSEYPSATVNESFNTTYNRMSDLYVQTNQLQNDLFQNDTIEGDPTIWGEIASAFGFITSALKNTPRILLSATQIFIAQPTTTSSGGIIYVYGTTMGLPPAIITILITFVAMALVFAVYKIIRGGFR